MVKVKMILSSSVCVTCAVVRGDGSALGFQDNWFKRGVNKGLFRKVFGVGCNQALVGLNVWWSSHVPFKTYIAFEVSLNISMQIRVTNRKMFLVVQIYLVAVMVVLMW